MRLYLFCAIVLLMVFIAVCIVGLCLGSFVNAFVWRLREQDALKEAKPTGLGKKLRELSITHGRSMCPDCQHQLSAKDLIPVVSWMTLLGKCRYCKKPIAKQYPAVELAGGILAAVSYWFWPYANDGWGKTDIILFALWLLIIVSFLALVIYDMRAYLLPDKIVRLVTFLAIVFTFVHAFSGGDGWMTLLHAAIGAVVISGLFYLLYQVSKGRWIGGGDVKLGIPLGLLAGGLLPAILLLFVASVLGTLYAGMVMLKSGKKQLQKAMRIPFGPFLILGCIVAVLFGANMIDWYSDIILGL